MRQYEIWWADLPEPIGTRPVLLLTRDGAYAYLNRLLAVEVTTRVRGIPQEVELGEREGMSKRCVANMDNIRAVPKASLRTMAGRLPMKRASELKRAFGHALAWAELTREY
jgi:mRNA interferase MazF